MNISSAIVYSQPGQEGTLHTQLAAIGGVEVHAVSDDGKWVISIEADNDQAAVALYETIEGLPGVLSVAMIFQQTESNPEQELTPCK